MLKIFSLVWVLNVTVVDVHTDKPIAIYRDQVRTPNRTACYAAGSLAAGVLKGRLDSVPGRFDVRVYCAPDMDLRAF